MINIGEAAKRSGIAAKTIRYYESIGLVEAAGRSQSGYRLYSRSEVEVLRFINRARSLGFSVQQVSDLLALWQDRNRASSQVKELAEAQVASIDQKVSELLTMRKTLIQLMEQCQGDSRPDCPILEDLASPVTAS
jgi:MerR family copper efflux transcriptional regulator|tara:strand:- start:1593 stop:1997 length:405 start_codon:yes stop_codon:yes gene_type:complete